MARWGSMVVNLAVIQQIFEVMHWISFLREVAYDLRELEGGPEGYLWSLPTNF
jgi:hypothetical protein